MPFTSETARKAGKKSRRGRAKMSTTTREFIFEIIKENREKVKYMLAELEPKDFINTWLKLVPYVIAMRHLQQFNVDELTKAETKELVKDIIENESK